MNEVQVEKFVERAIEKTSTQDIDWSLVNRNLRYRYLERSENYEKIKEVYINQNKQGDIVAIGKFDRRRYYEEDEYYFDDVYFITFTDERFDRIITFSEDKDLGIGFQLELGKLYRLIQIQDSGLKEKLNNWFND